MHNISACCVLIALLLSLIVLNSILGMNLFGCKFCTTLKSGRRKCGRKNFDSLLWAIITVFQVLALWDRLLLERTMLDSLVCPPSSCHPGCQKVVNVLSHSVVSTQCLHPSSCFLFLFYFFFHA